MKTRLVIEKIMMLEAVHLVLAWVAGVALGVFFFGGLWWTIRKSVLSKSPGLWFLGSLLLRMGVALAGFYYVGGVDWQRMVLCLLGFVMARMVVNRLIPPFNPLLPYRGLESSHAP